MRILFDIVYPPSETARLFDSDMSSVAESVGNLWVKEVGTH
jgi:hypothetical protein